MPMTVLVEEYWREISSGLAAYAIPVKHVVLHADEETLRRRINEDELLGPSPFRFSYLEPYSEALTTWLSDEADIVDTTALTPAHVARRVVDSL